MAVIRTKQMRDRMDEFLRKRGQSPQSFRDSVNADARQGQRIRGIKRKPSIEHIAQQIERESRGEY